MVGNTRQLDFRRGVKSVDGHFQIYCTPTLQHKSGTTLSKDEVHFFLQEKQCDLYDLCDYNRTSRTSRISRTSVIIIT